MTEPLSPHDALVSVIHEALHELTWKDAETIARAVEQHQAR